MPFVGASPSSTLRMLDHTFAHRHTHTHTLGHTRVHSLADAPRHIVTCTKTHNTLHPGSLIHTHVPPLPCDSSTHMHINTHRSPHTVNPHHPWVMNNICLSVPPSLPLAWLLASSWLHCHNVILSASLSAITKMCSDNHVFFSCTGPSFASAWD